MTTGPTADDVHARERWFSERRWYGEKGRRLTAIETDFTATDDTHEPAITIEIVKLTFDDGGDAHYLLTRVGDDQKRDGIESEALRQWLARGFAEGRELSGGDDARLVFNAQDGAAAAIASEANASRVFRGEQSNSSIVYGQSAMLKLFRKLRDGINPEVEIGGYLTRETDFEAFPRLLGTIDLERDGRVTTIAAVQQFIPSVGDAWTWITERITDEAARPTTIDAARQLGVRTGEMHRAFAAGTADAFRPEVASGAYAEAVRAEAAGELRDTIDQLHERGVGGTASLHTALESSLDTLLEIEGTMITRVHGDYHLGQVLRTEGADFAILDFEGEPTRPLAERRAKASPLRDVAGMLRSFDYAAETARRSAGGGKPTAIDAWYETSRAAFLEGYNEVVSGDQVLMHGWDPVNRQLAMAAFEVHKALYETRYELSNRPDWLEIPLNALRRIARDAI